ncbi:MAG: DNA cytosine methyltransferase, partial [Paracoccaceae bacterium]
AGDLVGFTQCHFFAGIGGWSYALRLVGWPDDRPVWTGSAPCQPFSAAGAGLAADDARHLAPKFIDLVRTGRPAVLFGEQVASAAVLGRVSGKAKQPAAPEWAWIEDLSDRLEAAHYAVGTLDIPAAGIGAPHIRQRTWFRAERMADADDAGPQGWGVGGDRADQRAAGADSLDGGLADADSAAGQQDAGGTPRHEDPDGRARWDGVEPDGDHGSSGDGEDRRPSAPDEFWRDADWLFCRDGKWRPVESGIFPLASGVPGRVGLLRGYGNAIVPQVAAEFIRLTEEALT